MIFHPYHSAVSHFSRHGAFFLRYDGESMLNMETGMTYIISYELKSE